MESEIENDLSRMGTYFKNNFVQGTDEFRFKYEAKLSFKTFNPEALERDTTGLALKSRYKEKVSLNKRVRSASSGPSIKEEVIAAR